MDLDLRRADYSLSDDQEALQAAFETFFERECPATRVRSAEPFGFDEELWQRLAGMRAVAMGVPESGGGDGAGLEELILVAEEVGRRVAPVPVIEAVVAARLLAAVPAGADTLDAVLRGSVIPTIALHAGGGDQLVPGGSVARAAIALVGDDLVLAERDRPPEQVANQGHAPIAWWDLGGSDVERRTLATGREGRDLFEQAGREWRILTSAALIGMSRAVLDLGVQHARDRVAFGAPIGTFQAVSHSLVDVAMSVDTGRRLVRKATWYQQHEPGVHRHLVPMAYFYAQEAAVEATTVAVHVLGGVGFTVESDAQLYFRRAKGWTLVAGDPQRELGALADQLFGPAQVVGA
ncbi:MAG: acyl-CoA/acyl-ACP dehydrogenase [Actinomycetota bacterium]|nr:acyl-CoA/acyl-ACP dehydrogenase [Actinomycetota bacterium]